MVDRFVLVVVVVHVVDVSVDDGLQRVDEQEHGHAGENEPSPVARREHVHHTVALHGAEGRPVPLVGGLRAEGNLLLAEAGDVHIDVRLELGLHLVPLDHRHHLRLLLSDGRVAGANLLEVLGVKVFHCL